MFQGVVKYTHKNKMKQEESVYSFPPVPWKNICPLWELGIFMGLISSPDQGWLIKLLYMNVESSHVKSADTKAC